MDGKGGVGIAFLACWLLPNKHFLRKLYLHLNPAISHMEGMNFSLGWKRTLTILWVANFCVTAGMSLVIPFLPLYIETLGIHRLQDIELWTGWIFSATFITSVFFQPVWGRFADKHGRKIMLLRAGFGM
jgi:hypothetical protein